MVPSKTTSSRFSQLWINSEIKQLSRIKQNAFNRAKESKNPKDWEHYKALKSKCQSECRKAHNNYIGNMLNDDINKNPKRFWSFIKSKRCDASGVAPLTKDGTTHSDSLKKANILKTINLPLYLHQRIQLVYLNWTQPPIQRYRTSPSTKREYLNCYLA